MTTTQPEKVSVLGREWRKQWDDFKRLAEATGEWAGIPIPIDGFDLQLEDRHHHKETLEKLLSKRTDDHTPREFRCSTTDVDETLHIRNAFYSRHKQAFVYLYQSGDGPVKVAYDYRARSVGERLTYWVSTIGVAQAWDLDAEMLAREKLRGMLKPHLYAAYELTGCTLETSPRSGVSYVLRRCRPTIAMVPSDRHDDEASMRILASLCMHPLGYYRDSFAGSMVPTDDTIAHLSWIRGDEHGYWAKCNQHPGAATEAGI